MRKPRLKAPTSVVADYLRPFVNRRAYTLQSNRPHPGTSRHYYYRPKDKRTGQGLSLTLDTIRRHLEGESLSASTRSTPPPSARSGWPSTRTMRMPLRTSVSSASISGKTGWSGLLRKAIGVAISGSSWLSHCWHVTAGFMCVTLLCDWVYQSRGAGSGKGSRSSQSRIT